MLCLLEGHEAVPEADEEQAQVGEEAIMPSCWPGHEAQEGIVQRAPEDLPMALCPA